jgi:hypothetical protein
VRQTRTVAADHTVSWQGQRWGLWREDVCAGLRGARVEIERCLDGSHWLRFRGRYLPLHACPGGATIGNSLRPAARRSRRCQNQSTPADQNQLHPLPIIPGGTLEADISIRQKTGHFYFALTVQP